MKRVMRGLLATVALIALVLGGAFVMAQNKAMGRLDETWQAHSIELPVPFPLSDAEVAALRAEKTAPRQPGSMCGSDCAITASHEAPLRRASPSSHASPRRLQRSAGARSGMVSRPLRRKTLKSFVSTVMTECFGFSSLIRMRQRFARSGF